MLNRRKGLGVLITLAVIGLLSVAPPAPAARTPARTASAATADATGHVLAHVKTRVTIRYFDRDGSLVVRRTLGPHSEGKVIRPPARLVYPADSSGTGGSNSLSGTATATVNQKGKSLLGHTLWSWTITTKWGWYRPSLTTNVTSMGHSMSHDNVWAYDGVQEFDHWYFQWVSGSPTSGHHHMEQAGFHGPCMSPSITCHEYPKNTINVHANGTFEWKKACC